MEEDVLLPEERNDSIKESDQQKHNRSEEIDEYKEFDIQEVNPEILDVEVEEGGTIDLGEALSLFEGIERIRIRRIITYYYFKQLGHSQV
ncbi:MAG TPA: hypothetical protein VEP90_19315 [Methylomirabilota bacterium]|nr:hypothetical protein [Methylomirabilota bacterium]